MSLKNKVAIVTGGSGGIGSETVKLLSSLEATVIFTYCKNTQQTDIYEACCSIGTKKPVGYRVNVSDYLRAKEFVHEVAAEYGQIDILVNNAGIRRDRTLLYMEKEDWDHVIETNLTGVFHVSKAVIPYMLKQKAGRIINISSTSGITGLAGQANYSASKAGIIGFTKAIAKEVALYGVSVNAIAPGAVDTAMLDGLKADYIKKMVEKIPFGRMCKPEEVAKMVQVLADEELAPQYLTGQLISLDGGMGN